MHQPIYLHTTQAIHFNHFIHTTHGHFWSNSSQPGLFLTIQKTEQWAVRGQPTQHTSVPLCGTEFHGHFRPHIHQSTIYCVIHQTRRLNSPWTVQTSPKNFHISVPSFGTDQTATHGLKSTQAFTKHLNQE